MVSLWPWKRDDSSPASFEKALSGLSAKINTCRSRLDAAHQQGRRFKALWTLYSSFTYLLYLVVVVLVVGWRNWGATEYSILAGAPLIIYLVRLALSSFYDYRTSKLQRQLDSLHNERDATIARLKAATKYDSTQQLLDKYSGVSAKPKSSSGGGGSGGGPANRKAAGPGESKQRTAPRDAGRRTTTGGFVPPPTANIPARNPLPASVPSTPQRSDPVSPGPPEPPFSAGPEVPSWQQQQQQQHQQQQQLPQSSPSAEFAPNAFPAHYATGGAGASGGVVAGGRGGGWSDRLLDLLLGEDENDPRNRLALICDNCRLVNGQAPPGAKSLDEVGRWRCAGCGALNGVESEAKRVLAEIRAEKKGPAGAATTAVAAGAAGGRQRGGASRKKATPSPNDDSGEPNVAESSVEEEGEEEEVLISKDEGRNGNDDNDGDGDGDGEDGGRESDVTQYSEGDERTSAPASPPSPPPVEQEEPADGIKTRSKRRTAKKR